MLNWNEDPITFREQASHTDAWQNQSPGQIEPYYLEEALNNTETIYMLVTNKETVDIHSNIVLPKGLRAYNSWENTYIEYLSGELSPVPVVTNEQIEILNWAKNNLFISFSAIFGFFLFLNILYDIFLRWRN